MTKTQKRRHERLLQKTLTGSGFTLVLQPTGRNVHVPGDWHDAWKRAEGLLRELTPDGQRYVYSQALVSDTRENPISSLWLGDFQRDGLDVVFLP